MPWGVAAAAVGSAVIGGVASQSAANTEAHAANNATNLQKSMFDQTQSNLSPFMATGAGANTMLSELLGVTPQVNGGLQYQNMTDAQRSQAWQAILKADNGNIDQARADFSARGAMGGQGYNDLVPSLATPSQPLPQGMSIGQLMKPFTATQFQSSPGYQFQLTQGMDALNNNAAAKGPTGNTLKDLMTFGQGLANQDYYNAANLYMGQNSQLYNFLSGLSGNGQNAAANLGGLGTTVAGNIGNNIIGAGNASAAGTIGAANAATGAINNVGQNYMLYQLMRQMNQGGGYNFAPDLIAASSQPSALTGGVGYGANPY